MSFKLDISYDFDFELIGLVTSARGFKLAWLLNDALYLQLIRMPDVSLEFLDGSKLQFNNFVHRTEHNAYQLIKNKSHLFEQTQKPYLLPELKEYDYFLRIDNATGSIDLETIREKLSLLSQIQYCTSINLEELKSRENLIF